MILSYHYRGFEADNWEFEETALDRINLLVGASGSGKTKFLNTLFNFSSTVVSGSPFRIGHWKLLVNTEGYNYEWEYDGSAADTADSSEPPHVHRESVKRRAVETTGDYELLVDRQSGHFLFF